MNSEMNRIQIALTTINRLKFKIRMALAIAKPQLHGDSERDRDLGTLCNVITILESDDELVDATMKL